MASTSSTLITAHAKGQLLPELIDSSSYAGEPQGAPSRKDGAGKGKDDDDDDMYMETTQV